MGSAVRVVVAAAVTGSALLAAVTPVAGAGPETRQETGRTVGVVDGDTVLVDVRGDGTSRPRAVRFTGVNTNEPGECHAGAATARIRALALGRRTRLLAIDPESVARNRIRRTVLVRQRDGSYRNLARTVLRASLANVAPLADEWAHNTPYRALVDRVAARGRRMWDTDACGRGPQQAARIRLSVRWNAPGRDAANLNGEWVSIRNSNTRRALRLGRWWVRDASPRRYVFPRGTRVPPGRTLRVHTGCGDRTRLVHYWCEPEERWLNASFDRRALGDGAYLVDPDGDVRRRFLYP